ncbi:MAG: acetate kinase [Thermoguttaceae bacterium]
MSILVINAGSSSVKFGLFRFDTLEPVARGLLDWAGQTQRATVTLLPESGEPIRSELDVADYRQGVVAAIEALRRSKLVGGDSSIRVVGHRLIHGGEEIRRPVRIDAAMKETIARNAHLAPLHIPAGLDAIRATESALPEVAQVGVFDTAFFADIPPAAYIYPLPYQWYEQWRIRRYGFHGTSHAYCTSRAAEMLGCDASELRLVICHIGQGSSATAVRGGTAVTNTMGFTPLEGLMMGTRCGTVDPGILLYAMREKGLSVDELDDVLHHKSGLLGISGLSSDFRQVEAAAADGHDRAQLALDVYDYRVKTTIGALTAALGGIDALVFTGGIGENSARLRRQVCDGLQHLGLHLDQNRNADCRPDTDIATDESPARVLVVHTREDLMIARESRRLILETPEQA